MKWTGPKNIERRLFGKARFKISYIFSHFVVCYASRSTAVRRHSSEKLSIGNCSLNNILCNKASLDCFYFPAKPIFPLRSTFSSWKNSNVQFSKPASFVASLFVLCEDPKSFWVVLSLTVAWKIFRMSCSRQCLFIHLAIANKGELNSQVLCYWIYINF